MPSAVPTGGRTHPTRKRFVACVALGLIALGILPRQASAQLACGEIGTSSDAESIHRLVELSDCYQNSGQAVRALDVLASALALAAAAPDGFSQTVAIRGRLGQVHVALGDYASALDNLLDGIDAAAAAVRPADAAPLLNELGGLYLATGEPLLGVAAFADSERLATAPELRITAGINLTRGLWEIGFVEAPRERLDRLRVETLALPASPAKATMLLSLADLYRETRRESSGESGSRDAARDLISAAVELAHALEDPRLQSYAYGELGRWYADLGALDRALTYARQAALTAQASGSSDSLYRWEWLSARLLRAMGEQPRALTAYRSAIDTLAGTQAAVITSARGFQKDVLPLYVEYADVMLASTTGLSDAARRAALTEVQQVLERLRLAQVVNYFENQCVIPEVFDLGQGQSQDAVVIYPVLFEDRTELLVSARGDLFQFTADVGLAELTAEVRLLRESIEDSSTGDAYLSHARQIYAWIIEPLMEVVEAAEPQALIIVPDGPLRTIPMAVLHDGRGFLVERYALATTPGLSLIGATGTQPVGRVLLGGIIAPVQGFPALPFVAQELQNIEQTFPSRVYADETFLSATLEREILEGGYSIVHMATHAQFESDYRRSFLLAYDDLITMDDLEDVMSSQRFTEQPVDLLVLSACQTAAGDQRAALGLAGVAVKAGVRSALASLWFINDESTAQLIAEFYRQLADPANSKAAALRGAQLLLMNDRRYRHPAFWAPFLMIGDWR